MIHRFANFEVDEAARELRAGGRVIELQPRVFELLVYLARHRDRVVPKDELLDNVWPGVVVSDGSLQRAISLARTALTRAGATQAIRTHSRAGYRLRSDVSGAMESDSGDSPVGAAKAAYGRGDWDTVIAEFQKIDVIDGIAPDDFQRWAHAAQCAGRPAEAIEPLERAVGAYSALGDRRRAAWAAILIAQLRLEWRELVLAHGWFLRAARWLADEPPCRERGYLDLLGTRVALMQNDLETALELAQRARAAGEQFRDPDLESVALVYVGEASLYLGKIREGLAAIDEAGVSVVASGLSPWAGGLVYCGVIYSCMTRADWQRAGQWTEQFTRWCEGKGTAAYPGLCRLHRAEVLAVRGRLDEAESEIRIILDLLPRHTPWAEGDAWRALGDILLARGDFTGARDAFGRAARLGWESQFGRALLHLAEGDPRAAARLLGRALSDNAWSSRSRRGQALAQHVIASAAAGDLATALQSMAELEADPDLTSTPALQALLAQARAEVLAAQGDLRASITTLRSSLRQWQALDAPITVAQTRCRLAELLARDDDRESAALELNAAMAAFQHANATRLLGNCERLRRTWESADRQSNAPRPARRRSSAR